MDVGIFQQILNAIEATMQPGAAAIRQQLLFWFQLFLWLEVLRTVWAFLYNGRLLPSIVGTLVKGSLVYWAMYHFPELLQGTIHTFVRIGLTAGGGHLTVTQFLDPGAWWLLGNRVCEPLYTAMIAAQGLTSIPQALVFAALWLAFMASFMVMALHILIWQIDMLLASVALLTLLPAMTFSSTAWIGQGALSYVINKAFRFGTGAILASLAFPLIERLTMTPPISFARCLVAIGAGWVFALLFWQINKMASGMLSGHPTLTAGTVLGSAIGSVATVLGLGAGGAALGARSASMVLQGGKTSLDTVKRLAEARQGMHTLRESAGYGPMSTGQRGMALLRAARQGAKAAESGPFAQRLGQWANAASNAAHQQTRQSLRFLVDVSRYVGADHPRGGAHR